MQLFKTFNIVELTLVFRIRIKKLELKIVSLELKMWELKMSLELKVSSELKSLELKISSESTCVY